MEYRTLNIFVNTNVMCFKLYLYVFQKYSTMMMHFTCIVGVKQVILLISKCTFATICNLFLICSNIHVNIWNSSKSKNPRITGLWHLLFRLLKLWNIFSLESCCHGDASSNFGHKRFKTHSFQWNCRIT